jgi:hypothetical protein
VARTFTRLAIGNRLSPSFQISCMQTGTKSPLLTIHENHGVNAFFLVLSGLYRGFAKFNDNLPTPPQSRCLANRIGAPVWKVVPFINSGKFLCQPSNFLGVHTRRWASDVPL